MKLGFWMKCQKMMDSGRRFERSLKGMHCEESLCSGLPYINGGTVVEGSMLKDLFLKWYLENIIANSQSYMLEHMDS